MNFRWRVTPPRRGRRGEHDRTEDVGTGAFQRLLARRERGPRGEHVVHQEAGRARPQEALPRRSAGDADALEARATAPRPQAHLVPSPPPALRQDGGGDRVDPRVHEAPGDGAGEPPDRFGTPRAARRGGRRCGHDQDA
ncbi:hypothetical protein JOD48_002972 [Oerskovia paurometabola]|nr:hypothetical protein [Oerskovia paurometabola]